jgi:hypothetical protein
VVLMLVGRLCGILVRLRVGMEGRGGNVLVLCSFTARLLLLFSLKFESQVMMLYQITKIWKAMMRV